MVNDKAVGIDLAIAKFAICSTEGSKYVYGPKNNFHSIKAKLVKKQSKH